MAFDGITISSIVNELNNTINGGRLYKISQPEADEIIDRLKHKCRAASTKVGGCGIRYTVMIGGHESFLYNEDEKWFVEAKEPCL